MDINLGVLHKSRGERDWLFGGADTKTILEDGQWGDYLVVKEMQHRGTETMACVSFSALTVIEILIKQRTGKEKNFSDRFTAKMSNTTKNGNYFFNVANSIKNDGFVGEALWQYVNGWDEYYKEIPEVVLKQAALSKEVYQVNYQWVDENIEAMKEALKHSPLQISARYAQSNTGEILNPTGQQNHAMVCYGYKEGEYWLIMDSYEYGGHLKKYAWDYKFGAVMSFTLTIKEEQTMTSPIKILKKKGSNDVGFWIPATSEAAFKSLGYAYSKNVLNADGTTNWGAVEGEFTINE